MIPSISSHKYDQYTPAISQTAGGRWAYISLIFSLFFFIHSAVNFSELTAVQLGLQLAVYLCFVSLYIWAIHLPSTRAVWALLTILLLLVIGTVATPGTSSLYGYVAFLGSYYLSQKRAWLLASLTVGAALCAAAIFDLWHAFYLAPALGISAGMVAYGRFSRAEFINRSIQQQHSEQIEQLATIAERERIARDMHDLLGHSLSSLALNAELIEKLLAKGQVEQAQQCAADLANTARHSLSEVRQAVTNMKLKGLGSVWQHSVTQLESQGFEVNASINLAGLPAKLESSVIMLVKEWFTNIMRHSAKGEVNAQLFQQAGQLCFKAHNPSAQHKFIEGNGIHGIRARVAALGGSVNLSLEDNMILEIAIPFEGGVKE